MNQGNVTIGEERKDNAFVAAVKKVTEMIDINNDGKFDIKDLVIITLKIPGVTINREDFLLKELYQKHTANVIQKAIHETPQKAGISKEEMDTLADEVIRFERSRATSASAALGMPGGLVMVATLTADWVQYFSYLLRAAQKMMYLYGFPQLNFEETDTTYNPEAIDMIVLCLGTMYDISKAERSIKILAKGFAQGFPERIMNNALTKGILLPVIQSVSKWFSINMTQKIIADSAERAIPVVGGITGGAITYFSFKPCCERLKSTLQDTYLSNPNHIESKEEMDFTDTIA